MKLTKIHYDINIVYQLICLFIKKKQNKKETKINSRFMPSTNMKQLFKGVLQKNCYQDFRKFTQKLKLISNGNF